MIYCKRGNIRGTLIFVNFAQISASANSKTLENICDTLYAHLGHVGVVYWLCVLMQMGNILENVWGLLCFYAAQLLVNVSWYDVNFVQYKNDKWASAKRKFNNLQMFLCRQTRNINPAKLTAFTVGMQVINLHHHQHHHHHFCYLFILLLTWWVTSCYYCVTFCLQLWRNFKGFL